MAFSMFDDRDGFIDEADPVSPLSNPDAGAGTAVLERAQAGRETYGAAACVKAWSQPYTYT